MARKGENIYRRKDGRWEGLVWTGRGLLLAGMGAADLWGPASYWPLDGSPLYMAGHGDASYEVSI